MADSRTRRGARSVQRIVRAASRVIGRSGYDGASMGAVAAEAGVSKGLLHYHFDSKEDLLIEAQRVAFRELHRRFSERAKRGDRGLEAALDALDAMWRSIRGLRGGAAFIVETLAMASHNGALSQRISSLYGESTQLLDEAIQLVFADELQDLAVSPDRMAVLIRVLLEGLTVELAQAHTAEDAARVDQAYRDFRELFERYVLSGHRMSAPDPETLGPVPLPW
ncbi:MAG: TetR/AcrR family transcriptional regulator [Oligoflexia bacterium]|nr:TetR/AcrR family transcriptional regulator [Oligoflexia bacterium]